MSRPRRPCVNKGDADRHLNANRWHQGNATAGDWAVYRGGSHCIAHLAVPDDGRLRHLYDLHVGVEGCHLGRG
jgi:hypothetical protein